jgi:serine/threonine protein kinase
VDINLEPVYDTIMTAVSAEGVFGVTNVVLPPEDMLRYLEAEYHKLKMITEVSQWTHPDDITAATDADARLEYFYEEAKGRLADGMYGLSEAVTAVRGKKSFETAKRKYYVGDCVHRGNTSVYEGFCEVANGVHGLVLIKLADKAEDNYRIEREKRINEALHRKSVPQWKHLPLVLDNFKAGSRMGLVMRKFDGHTLNEIMAMPMYKAGIDRKHVVWMFNRLLSVVGYAHSCGIIHGNIEPTHVMIRPDDHNLCLIDWSTAVVNPSVTGERLEYVSDYSAPELVEAKRPPLPSADIYSIGKLAIRLLGGNIRNNKLPSSVEKELQNYFKGFVNESPIQRPQDAWVLHKQLIYIVEKLWGKRKFLKFEVQ